MRAQVKNQVTLIGRLGDKPTFFGEDDRGGARFDVAVNESWGQDGERQERVDWFTVICWNGLVRSCEHLAKGDLVAVAGKLRTRDWEHDGAKRRSVEIHAADVAFLDVKALREKKGKKAKKA